MPSTITVPISKISKLASVRQNFSKTTLFTAAIVVLCTVATMKMPRIQISSLTESPQPLHLFVRGVMTATISITALAGFVVHRTRSAVPARKDVFQYPPYFPYTPKSAELAARMGTAIPNPRTSTYDTEKGSVP